MALLAALKDNWSAALVVFAGLVAFVLIAIFAPADTQHALFGVDGLICTLVGIFVRSPRDRASLRPPPPPPKP